MAKKKEYTDINLVKTDYDNMRNLKFFINQHKKALEMIDEVNNFYKSFIKSKLVSYKKLIKDEFICIEIHQESSGDVKIGYANSKFYGDFTGYDYSCFEDYAHEYIESLNKKKLDDYDILCINKHLSVEFFNRISDCDITRFIITSDKKLIHIPNEATYEFEISDDETKLDVTFISVHRYKKYMTPSWLPWTVDTNYITLSFDTTTNNFISYKTSANTHEEQTRTNRGY